MLSRFSECEGEAATSARLLVRLRFPAFCHRSSALHAMNVRVLGGRKSIERRGVLGENECVGARQTTVDSSNPTGALPFSLIDAGAKPWYLSLWKSQPC